MAMLWDSAARALDELDSGLRGVDRARLAELVELLAR